MRSITDWLLLASVHHDPVPSQVTAAGLCTQVTRPGITPRGTPRGESGEANSEEGKVPAAATDRANCRRVISIFSYSSAQISRNYTCQVYPGAIERGSDSRQSIASSLWTTARACGGCLQEAAFPFKRGQSGDAAL